MFFYEECCCCLEWYIYRANAGNSVDDIWHALLELGVEDWT